MAFSRDNFSFYVGERLVTMNDGVLAINGARHYHYDRDSAAYAMAVTLAAVLHIATECPTMELMGVLIEEAIDKGGTE